jgi:hypothetical protein
MAANAWASAVGAAAGKGDHRPAKELLLHTRVIEPMSELARGQGLQVLIFGDVVVPGLPHRPPHEIE